MKTIAIIVAGGSGSRFGSELPKQFVPLLGREILVRTLESVDAALEWCDHEIVLALPEAHIAAWHEIVATSHCLVPHCIVAGGETLDEHHAGEAASHSAKPPIRQEWNQRPFS